MCWLAVQLPSVGAAAAHDAVVGREDVARVRDAEVAVYGRAANGRRASSERHVEDLAGEEALGVRHPVEPQNRRLRGAVLLRNPRNGAPDGHDVGEVHHIRPADRVAAARQRHPELLPDGHLVRVGHIVGGGDVAVGDEAREDPARDGVERVPFCSKTSL